MAAIRECGDAGFCRRSNPTSPRKRSSSICSSGDNGSGAVYWTVNNRDAEQHPVLQTFGNGVTQANTYDRNTGFLLTERAGPSNAVAQFDYAYDTLGNLTDRADGYEGTFEYSCYDALNRLTQYAAGNAVTACTSASTPSP